MYYYKTFGFLLRYLFSSIVSIVRYNSVCTVVCIIVK